MSRYRSFLISIYYFSAGIKPKPFSYFSVLPVVEVKEDSYVYAAASQAIVYMAYIFPKRKK